MKGETTRQKIEYRRGPERLAILADLIKQLCVFHLYFKHDYSSEISSQAPIEKEKRKRRNGSLRWGCGQNSPDTSASCFSHISPAEPVCY